MASDQATSSTSAPLGIEFTRVPLLRWLNRGRHLVPPAWRPGLRNLLFSIRPLTIVRPTGIRLRIGNDTDWIIYTEVFRKGEYDAAIGRAITSARPGPMCVVDLGANVGFVTLRTIEAAREAGPPPLDVSITAVEGSARRVDEFRSRVIEHNALDRQVRVVHGLVGERSGRATLFEATAHGDSSLFRRSPGAAVGATVAFVDLSELLASQPTIHLLKCDIEGAELQFMRNYRDVLDRTRVAVFELHDELCDTEMCRRLLRGYGFLHESVLRQIGPYSLHCVWR